MNKRKKGDEYKHKLAGSGYRLWEADALACSYALFAAAGNVNEVPAGPPAGSASQLLRTPATAWVSKSEWAKLAM